MKMPFPVQVPQQTDSELVRMLREIRASCDKHSWAALLLSAAAKDPKLQMGILRFIDVLPTLVSSKEMYEQYRQFVGPHIGSLSAMLRWGGKCAEHPMFRAVAMQVLRWLIEKKVAPHFIVSDERALDGVIRRFAREGAETSVDFLGELVISSKEADEYLARYCAAMNRYGGKEKPFQVSVKFSALYPFFAPENRAESVRHVGEKFQKLLRVAVAPETNSFVTVDAELRSNLRLTEDVFTETLLASEFRKIEAVGIALQAYQKDALKTARRLVALAEKRGAPFFIRLVKGAYLETERALAEQKGWPSPVWDEKSATDRSFNEVAAFLARHWGKVFVSPATHNPENILYVESLARSNGFLDDPGFVFQVLYGLGEPVRRVLQGRGRRVLVYTPVGNLLEGMAYLARRILENTSNQNFLFTLTR